MKTRPRVAVLLAADPASFRSTAVSFRKVHRDVRLVIGCADPRQAKSDLGDLGDLVEATTLPTLVNTVFAETHGHIAVIAAPAEFPRDALSVAFELVDEHLRVATVSFWSNAAGMLSFPERNQPGSHQVENLDAEEITRRLRAGGAQDDGVWGDGVPIPHAAGPVVVLAGAALGATGPIPELGWSRPEPILTDLSFRGRDKGLVDVLEPRTFIARLFDVGGSPHGGFLDLSDRHLVYLRHPSFPHLADQAQQSTSSPLGIAHASARAKVLGLRVLVDGTCFGPKEMGTQVQALALIRALCARPDIVRVSVPLPAPAPQYAATVLSHEKVDARSVPPGDFSSFGAVDIVHRPFQPDGALDIEAWRRVGARTVLTIQDLIAFHVGHYHPSGEQWLAYRDALRSAVAEVDAVISISEDTVRAISAERLPIESERLHIVGNGTDHLRGDEEAVVPATLLARGFVARQFIVVLGVNYTHKNRDLALQVLRILQANGWDMALVLVGASAPFGSSRNLEATWSLDLPDVFTIPDVSSAERNWLLRHASLNLYPTSAEGFGLVPYEAARFGTPTVFVPFGPLGEVGGTLPVLASDWEPASLAEAAEKILRDPALARRQIDAALAAGSGYTWDATATEVVAIYHSVLGQPSRR